VRDWARVETSYSHVLSSLTFIAGWLSNLTSRWLADFLVRPSVPLGDAKTDFQPLSITQVTQKIKPFFPLFFLANRKLIFFFFNGQIVLFMVIQFFFSNSSCLFNILIFYGNILLPFSQKKIFEILLQSFKKRN